LTNIPLKTIVKQSTHIENHFLAKSGISFRNSDNQLAHVYGFGSHSNKNKAMVASKFELLERLYATYDLHEVSSPSSYKIFQGFLHSDFKIKMEFDSSEVLLDAKMEENLTDANGLGCHHFFPLAVRHGLFEVIERHLLANIWYNDYQLFSLGKSIILKKNLRLRYYCLANANIPLAIAILDKLEDGVWILGSCVRLPFRDALTHAKNEAVMLLESAISQNEQAYSKEMDHRLDSLKDIKFSLAREIFFQSKVIGKIDSLDCKFSISSMIRSTLNENSLWVVPLHSSNKLNVVRIIDKTAKNPRWLRIEKSEIPLDPFC